MKTYSIVIFVLFYSFWASAQSISGVIKYRYKYTHNVETSDASVSNKFDLPAYLYFNTERSLFDHNKLDYQKDEAVIPKAKFDEYGQMYFMDKTKGQLYIREFIYAKPYITYEPIPVIAWQLKNEVKTISGYVCKKAEATFRGRKYTVWYTSAIPVSVGPWKLQGLPGAILEAKSEDGEVEFITESIRIPAYVQEKLSLTQLPDGKIVTYKEYLEAFEKERLALEEKSLNIVMNLFEEENKKGNIKTIPKKGEFKHSISKMFTIEKYEQK